MFARVALAGYRSSRELGQSGVWAPAIFVSEADLSAMLVSGTGGGERLHWITDWWSGSVGEGWIQTWISGGSYSHQQTDLEGKERNLPHQQNTKWR